MLKIGEFFQQEFKQDVMTKVRKYESSHSSGEWV